MTTTRRRAVRGTAAALAGTLLATTLVAATATTATVPFAAPAAAAPGDVLLAESFDGDDLPEGWTPVLGDWQVRDGRLVGDAPDGSSPARIVFGRSAENYRLDATLRFESVDNASRWAGAILDVAPDGTTPWWQAVLRSTTTASNGVEIAQRTAADAWNVPYTGSASADAATGRDVHLSVEVQGAAVTYALDGRTVLEGRIDRSRDGALGFVTAGATVSVDDVTVMEIEPASSVGGDGELPVTVAHRGYSSVAPENTLAAVAAGMRTGAEYVEVDVHTTADGVPVVLHDQTVDRTTDGTGDVAVLAGEQVTALDAGSWFSPRSPGSGCRRSRSCSTSWRPARRPCSWRSRGPRRPRRSSGSSTWSSRPGSRTAWCSSRSTSTRCAPRASTPRRSRAGCSAARSTPTRSPWRRTSGQSCTTRRRARCSRDRASSPTSTRRASPSCRTR